MAAITDIHVVAPKETHRYTMIFFHGRDDDPAQFRESVLESETSAPKRELPDLFPSMKWVFPASRTRESVRFKETMVQWFDMWSVENPSEREEIQKEGLRESVSAILALIHQEAKMVPLERIFLGGISQGCATAILALLCGGMKLGGFVGLCSWMPLRAKIMDIASKQQHGRSSLPTSKRLRELLDIERQDPEGNDNNALDTPIFLSHSVNDEVVMVQNGRLLRDCLETLGMKVTWREYEDGGHWIYEPEDENIRNGIDDIKEFVDMHS
ncbi:phospholipase carboxylesterase protein [Rutstroemia sp. NJR-2017a WRK4]|nr:phospholipase carboxylesterase protein [Rutstroemia sp. NJR-2017a WRK4]